MKKLSFLQIISFLFPLLLWGYFLLAPNIQSEQLLIKKNILGAKFASQSVWTESPILAEKLTNFFEPNPVKISKTSIVKKIIPKKFSVLPFKNYAVGFLQSPLTDADIQIINQSDTSLNFDILITTTSQIPSNINANMATVYLKKISPSDSFNKKFREKNQPLIWAEAEILLNLNHKELKIFKN